jgi:hypothetical protein
LRQAQQRFRPDKELWRIPQLYFIAKALKPVVDFRMTHKRLSILRACSIKVPSLVNTRNYSINALCSGSRGAEKTEFSVLREKLMTIVEL